MQKFWCVLSLLALPVCAMAQDQPSPVRPLFVQDVRDRGVPLADNGHDMLPEAEAKKLPVVSDSEMYMHDAARRAQVAKLLQDGKLKTAEDFYDAALIFQHGSTADDYLLAHVLAMDAMAKGDTSARALAAVTLDRYLQRAGKKQIFGTQYLDARYAFSLQHPDDKNLDEELKAIPDSKQTLEPYDQTLLPDAIRADFCVVEKKKQADYITAANAGQTLETPSVENCVR
jgi:hypothetical protein